MGTLIAIDPTFLHFDLFIIELEELSRVDISYIGDS